MSQIEEAHVERHDPSDLHLQRVSLRYRVGFLLASMVGGLSSVCLKQLLLPIQVGQLDPTNTTTTFAVVASLGAFAGLVASPLTGALSDRTASRWGKRRPWLILGTLVAVVGLVTMAQAHTIPSLLIGEVLAQIGVDTILATVTALIPDQLPPGKRAGIAALNGMAPIVGGVLGLVLVTKLTDTRVIWQGYLALALVSTLFMLIFLLGLRESASVRDERSPLRWRAFFAGFIRPLASSDFTYTLLSRCLVFLSFTILGAYTFFYLEQGLRMSAAQAAQGVASFQVISTGTLIVVALGAGALSDHLHRIKPFIIVGALFMAAGLLLIVIMPTWSAMIGAAVLFGGGFGGVLGVDIALAVRVLPKASDHGKDLGLMSSAIFLPLIVSPLIGAFILKTFHSFALLFLVAACASAGAAMLVLPIKAVQ